MQHISPTRTAVYRNVWGFAVSGEALTGAVFMTQFLPGQDTLGCACRITGSLARLGGGGIAAPCQRVSGRALLGNTCGL